MAIQAERMSWKWGALLALAFVVWLVQEVKPGLLGSGGERTTGGEGYEEIAGARWVDHRNNDGDSFRLRLADGRVEEFRLYFVDAPESAFKSYRGGDTNHDRIADQARVFGISPEAAVGLGREAKKLVRELFDDRELKIHTAWDDPFGDQRYHAFVEDPEGGWLHERLVREGLVRIHTKGAALPDGTPGDEQERRLRELEEEARARGRGGWSR